MIDKKRKKISERKEMNDWKKIRKEKWYKGKENKKWKLIERKFKK